MELLEQIPVWYPLLTFVVGFAFGAVIFMRGGR